MGLSGDEMSLGLQNMINVDDDIIENITHTPIYLVLFSNISPRGEDKPPTQNIHIK